MSDPPAKDWLAGNPTFVAPLGDPDREVEQEGEDTLPLTFTHVPPTSPRPPRPLLDLFPIRGVEPNRASGAGLIAAGGRVAFQPSPSPSQPAPSSVQTAELFYGLREKPFSLSTDPRFAYHSEAFEAAAQALLEAVRVRSGPAMLTAPVGMGKTTLCRTLVPRMDDRIVAALVLDAPHSMDDLLKRMLVELRVLKAKEARTPLPRERMIAGLYTFLDSLVPLQRGAVLVIDEAQNLPADLLADIALTLGPGSRAAGVLQLILVGQPSLIARLNEEELRALNPQATGRTQLGALRADELSGYVAQRLSIAGSGAVRVFDEAAIATLFAVSNGVPRIVNLLCDRAMVRGHRAAARVIGESLIAAAAVDLDLEPAEEPPPVISSVLIGALFAVLVLVGGAGAAYFGRDGVRRAIVQWQQIPPAPAEPVLALPPPIAPVPPPATAAEHARRAPRVQ